MQVYMAHLLSTKVITIVIQSFAMSHLQYFDYEGFGQTAKQHFNYSQAVRIDNRIEISGQGTFDTHLDDGQSNG